jgi:hypothetical protein
MRIDIVWQYPHGVDEYWKALPGSVESSVGQFGQYRRDYWFWDKLYHDRTLFILSTKVWDFHEDIEQSAEILALGAAYAADSAFAADSGEGGAGMRPVPEKQAG